MQLQLLGPLEILDVNGVRVFVSGHKRRALLAALVVRAGRTVSMDRLIEELWGAAPPANAVNALQAHIGRLRRAIESASGEVDRIVTRPPGYCLLLRPGETDASEFAAAVSSARTLPPTAAIPRLRAALALWRGPALDGCVAGDICAAEAAMLTESRLAAMEALYETCLRAGRHADVIVELEEATAAHPLRERFYDQLMVALTHADRRPEALAVYDRARRRLTVELGVEPGKNLRARAHAIRAGTSTLPSNATDLTREIAELQKQIETLATRQEALARRLAERPMAPS
jgi:DNA-binding SARP family transcriptional activator